MSELIGQLLMGRYRVVEQIGKGGMAQVYRSLDEGRTAFAIKVLHLTEEGAAKAFENEARALKKLAHPHIVRLYDFEQDSRRQLGFLVMDYIQGSNLRELIIERDRPFAPLEILSYLEPVATGLNFAHRKKIYHLDVKPSNILLSQDGRVYLSDFGVAVIGGGRSRQGTHSHMAPEQFMGDGVDGRTDVYGLGVTLFELATGGKRPFSGKNPSSVSHGSTTEKRMEWEHIYQPVPSPRSYNSGVTEAYEQIIMRCLQKDAHRRYDSTLDLLEDLKKASQGSGSAPKPPDSSDHTAADPFPRRSQPKAGPQKITRPPNIPAGRTRAKAYLHVLSGPATGQTIPIDRDPFVIGRHRDCALVLQSKYVSRQHACIRTGKGYYYVQDLGSVHGTFVNGQRITQAGVIPNGSRIHIADIELSFQQTGR